MQAQEDQQGQNHATAALQPANGDFAVPKQTEFTFNIPGRFPPSQMMSIGIGAQGAVCSCLDVLTGRRMAVKKLSHPFQDVTFAKRSYRELKLMRLVDHPNIIKLLYAYTPDTTLDAFREVYIFTELMDGSLRNVIAQTELDHERISFLVYQMLCGVRHLHAAGIVHRDLKPSNIAVNKNCNLKILDFGLARSVDTSFTMTQYVVTRHYRAPEIILDMEYDTRVDIWSIGCIMAELITGQVLFPGSDHVDQWMRIVQVLGSPRPEFIARMTPGTQQYINRQPTVVGRKFEEIFPDEVFDATVSSHPHLTNDQARDFLLRMLAFDPMERISVDEALHHPYIHVWYNDEDIDRPVPKPYDHSIDVQHLSVGQWKALLFEEIQDIQRTMSLDGPPEPS